MHLLMPGKTKATQEKARSHIYELAAQRIMGFVEPRDIGWNGIRGREEEALARDLYAKTYAPVEQVGFVANDDEGFPIGYSPDGLVGDDGLIECKSRLPKIHLALFTAEAMPQIPDENIVQVQAALMVTGRKWLDYVSYCGGMNMVIIRAVPDSDLQSGIRAAAINAEAAISAVIRDYHAKTKRGDIRAISTPRTVYGDMVG
jgi:hypothetical protein